MFWKIFVIVCVVSALVFYIIAVLSPEKKPEEFELTCDHEWEVGDIVVIANKSCRVTEKLGKVGNYYQCKLVEIW
jgi:hypothetical protein